MIKEVLKSHAPAPSHSEKVDKPLYRDPFHPVLTASESFVLSTEQEMYLKDVLDVACSDSAFAKKAYEAIVFIMTNGPVPVSTITSLNPSSAKIGDPSFTLHVHGRNFTTNSIINFAAHDEPTIVVDAGELTTGVDMSVWHGADVLPVIVKDSLTGESSQPMSFTFTAATVEETTVVPPAHELPHPPVPPIPTPKPAPKK